MSLEDYHFKSMSQDIQQLRSELTEIRSKNFDLGLKTSTNSAELSFLSKAFYLVAAVVYVLSIVSMVRCSHEPTKGQTTPTTQSSDASAQQAQ